MTPRPVALRHCSTERDTGSSSSLSTNMDDQTMASEDSQRNPFLCISPPEAQSQQEALNISSSSSSSSPSTSSPTLSFSTRPSTCPSPASAPIPSFPSKKPLFSHQHNGLQPASQPYQQLQSQQDEQSSLPPLPPEIWTHIMAYLVLSRHLPHAWTILRLVSRGFRAAVEAAFRTCQLPRIRGDLLVLDQAYFDVSGNYHGLVSCPLVFSHLSIRPPRRRRRAWEDDVDDKLGEMDEDEDENRLQSPRPRRRRRLRKDVTEDGDEEQDYYQPGVEIVHLIEPPESAARTRRLVAHEEAIVRASRECRAEEGGGLFEWAQPLEGPSAPSLYSSQVMMFSGIGSRRQRQQRREREREQQLLRSQQQQEQQEQCFLDNADDSSSTTGQQGTTAEAGVGTSAAENNNRSTSGCGETEASGTGGGGDRRTKAQLEEQLGRLLPPGRLYFSIGRDPGVRRSLGDPRVETRHVSVDQSRARTIDLRVDRRGRSSSSGDSRKSRRRRNRDERSIGNSDDDDEDDREEEEEEEEEENHEETDDMDEEEDEGEESPTNITEEDEVENEDDYGPRMVSFEWRKLVSSVLAAPERRICSAVARKGVNTDLRAAEADYRESLGKGMISEEMV